MNEDNDARGCVYMFVFVMAFVLTFAMGILCRR